MADSVNFGAEGAPFSPMDDYRFLEEAETSIKGMLASRTSLAVIFRVLKNRGFSGNRQKLVAWLEGRGLWEKRQRRVEKRGVSEWEVDAAIGKAAEKAKEVAVAERAERERIRAENEARKAEEAARIAEPEPVAENPADEKAGRKRRLRLVAAPRRRSKGKALAMPRRERKPLPKPEPPAPTQADRIESAVMEAVAVGKMSAETLPELERRVGESLSRHMDERIRRLEEMVQAAEGSHKAEIESIRAALDERLARIEGQMADAVGIVRTIAEKQDGMRSGIETMIRESGDGQRAAIEAARAEFAESVTGLSDAVRECLAAVKGINDGLTGIDERLARSEAAGKPESQE